MAVTIKKKALTITSLVKRLFTLEQAQGGLLHLAEALEHGGYKLTAEPTQLKIQNSTTMLLATSVKLAAIQKALKGKLTIAGKKVLQGHVEQFIKKAYNLMPDAKEQENLSDIYNQTMAAYHGGTGTNKVKAIKTYRMLTGCDLKYAKDKVEAWIDTENEAAGEMPIVEGTATFLGVEAAEAPHSVTFTVEGLDAKKGTFKDITDADDDEPKYGVFTSVGPGAGKPDVGIGTRYANVTDSPIALEVAEKLHQPIKGTSGGSIYHVIALGKDAKVAARINNTDVAIRVTALTDKGEAGCKLAGLDKKNGGHWSLHLHPDTKLLARKCVGAVLYAMGLDFDGISGKLEYIEGAGK